MGFCNHRNGGYTKMRFLHYIKRFLLMNFKIKSKRTKQNNRALNIKNETSQVCLDPGYLVENLSAILFKNTKRTSGHIHFYFRNKSDHIIFSWSEGKLKKIVAKSPSCKKGQYVHWKHSQFCDYECEQILRELLSQIERIEIDGQNFNKARPSYNEFARWLIQN